MIEKLSSLGVKDLSSYSVKIQKSVAEAAKKAMTHSKEEIAELASNPKYAKIFENASKKITTPKNLNLGYFTSNIKKLAK